MFRPTGPRLGAARPAARPAALRAVLCVVFLSHQGIVLAAPGRADGPAPAPAAMLASSLAPSDSLTLPRALKRAALHPSLEAFELEARAREAVARQAAMLPNPELSLEAENFGGSGSFAGARGLETTVRLEQSVPLGGKLAGRRRLADAESRLARGDREIAGYVLARRVRDVFAAALAAQERERLAARKVALLEEAERGVARRRAAGGGQPADALKLRVERARAEQERLAAAAESVVARARLAALTGDSGIAAVRGAFEATEALPPWDSVRAAAARHPARRRFASERAVRRAALDLSRAARVPDLSVSAGVRRVSAPGGGDMAVVAGIGVPLPLWNRNAGETGGAALRLDASAREEAAARATREAEVRALWTTLALRASELQRLRVEILPAAEQAAVASRDAFQGGRHSVLDMLDGQRLLFEINADYYEALAAWHRDYAELQDAAGLFTLDAER